MEVKVSNDDIDAAIRGLKRLVSIDNIHFEVKKRLLFIKPSERKRFKQMHARQRVREQERKREKREMREHPFKWSH